MRVSFLSVFLAAPVLFSFLPASAPAQAKTSAAAAAVTAASQQKSPVAAAATAAAASVSQRYAGESFVIDRSDWVYSENNDGTGYREHTVAVHLQSEAALRTFGVISIGFASASEHVEFHYARVRRADGSVVETPVSDAIEQPEQVTREAPFYSDLKELQLPVKNLRVGDTLEWQARIVKTRAEAPGEFWGNENWIADDAVTLQESVELRVPAKRDVIVWTNPRPGIKPTEKTEGDTKIYRWQNTQLIPTTGPEAEAVKKAKKGKLLTADEEEDREHGALPSLSWTTFKTWPDVGSWYRKLEGTRSMPDDEIKAKVAELTAKSTTEEEKVRAVYAFVSAQVRYVGVAFGVGRFQPHQASDVLHNQYGDCKDKATLLAATLEALGLHPDTVLIGQGIRMNKAVPSPSAFNHAISRVKVGNDEVWLDATQEVGPYRVLLFQLRDKDALVVPEKGEATLEHTPRDLPFTPLDTWKAVGKLDAQGVSESHVTLTFHSDDEVMVRSVIHSVPPAQYDAVAQKIFNNLGYAGTTSHAAFSRPEDTSGPFTFDADYHREKGGDWDNLKIIPQLAPVQLPTVDEKDPPIASLNLGSPHSEMSTAELKLPPGWTAELPEAIHGKSAWATYDETYRFDNGTLYVERKVAVLQQYVPANQWREYKKWADAVSLGSDFYVQLIRSGADGKPMAPGLAANHVSNQEAETLIEQAIDAERKSDVKTADALLKRARTLDPQARRLWVAEGWRALESGKVNEAVDDFNKELSLYPSELEVYGAMATAQNFHNDKAGAEQSLRAWIKADPSNEGAAEQLAQTLMADNKYTEAVDAATKALALVSEDDRAKKETVRLILGRAQIKAGQLDKGEETLVALLKETDEPGVMNDAGYELADAKRQLPLDEEKVRLALDRMNDETTSWTLDEKPATLAQKSALVAATWDTLGWILYREGKTKEARTFILASWLNGFHKEVRDHLDEIDTALNQPKEPSGRKAEQQLRTIQLGAYSGPKGFAEYRLLLSHNKVERLAPTGDKKLPEAEPLIKAMTLTDYFPQGSNARIVRAGVVNCTSSKCELVLEP